MLFRSLHKNAIPFIPPLKNIFMQCTYRANECLTTIGNAEQLARWTYSMAKVCGVCIPPGSNKHSRLKFRFKKL